MNTKRIRSIGFLHNFDGSINLTPCIDGNNLPTLVNISKAEFNAINGDQEKMKAVAAQKLGL